MKFSSNTDLVGAAWPVWGAILGAIVISMVIGAFTERVIIRPISAGPCSCGRGDARFVSALGYLCVSNGGGTNVLVPPFRKTIDDR